MKRLACLILLSSFLFGCASKPTYSYDHDASVDFSELKTYRWYDDVYPSRDSRYRSYGDANNRVRRFINRELTSKGFTEAKSGNADFLVNYHVSKEERYSAKQFNNYYDGGVHGGVSTGSYGSSVAIGYSTGGGKPKTYAEGTVVIDLLSSEAKGLIWRSIAEGRLPKKLSPSIRDNAADLLSKEMFSAFPPQ